MITGCGDTSRSWVLHAQLSNLNEYSAYSLVAYDQLLAVLRILGSIVNIIPIPVLWIGVDRFAPNMRECQQATKQG